MRSNWGKACELRFLLTLTKTSMRTLSALDPFPRNAYRSGRRFLRTDSSWPVFFRLPAFPVKPTRTSSSNSPPIFSLHATHTSVSGSVRRRAGGIEVPHRRHSRDPSFIRTIPFASNPGVEKASEPVRSLQQRKSWWGVQSITHWHDSTNVRLESATFFATTATMAVSAGQTPNHAPNPHATERAHGLDRL